MLASALRALVLAAFASVGVASTAHAALYQVSIKGTQSLQWSVNGTTGDCEVRQGTGSGKVEFSFASKSPGYITLPGASAQGSITGQATGKIDGSFADTVATPCPGQTPADATTDPTSDCGATKFGLRADLTLKGHDLYVTGTSMPPASTGGDCPFYVGSTFVGATPGPKCGDGSQMWQRSWGVSSAGGAGLLASKLPLGKLKKPTTTLTKRQTVSCTLDSQYSGGIKISGTLQYTLTFKRSG
jgi:hypothetical protein